MHRLRSANRLAGPIFANSVGKPLSLGSVVNRVILPFKPTRPPPYTKAILRRASVLPVSVRHRHSLDYFPALEPQKTRFSLLFREN